MSQPSTPRVLIADDQADVLIALRLLLKEQFDADTAGSVQEIRVKLENDTYDLLLMDLNYARDTTSGREGLELLAQVHERDPLLPVVVMTGWGNIETAVEAMRRGARTFIHKPWDNAHLSDILRREVEHGRAARRAQRSLSREREEAQAIQRALLPVSHLGLPGCEITARLNPASAFGGDFYDVVPLTSDRVAVSIGDVCGKGLPAALLMANVQASMRAFAAADPSPSTIAARINRELTANARLRRFVTFFCAIYDAGARHLAFTNAGHLPPILVQPDGSITRLTGSDMVLGAFETANYDQRTITVNAGDRIVLFTDGITEPADVDDREFGDERLVDAVLRMRSRPGSAIADGIFEEVLRFTDGRLEDDATLVVMTIH